MLSQKGKYFQTISADLKKLSGEKKVNAPELPNIFAAYGDTSRGYGKRRKKLVSINDYMSDEENGGICR